MAQRAQGARGDNLVTPQLPRVDPPQADSTSPKTRTRTAKDRRPFGGIAPTRDRWKAFYIGPDRKRHTPGFTFATKTLAGLWLNAEELLIIHGQWTPPADRRAETKAQEDRNSTTLDTFARTWINTRTTPRGGPLAPRTRVEYIAHLGGRLAPLGELPLSAITRGAVETWWLNNADKPAARFAAYSLLKSIMRGAVRAELIDTNPCQVENASRRPRITPKRIRSQLVTELSPAEVNALIDAYPRERFRAMVALVAFCGLRPSEALALTRADVRRAHLDGLPRWSLSITEAVSTDEDLKGRAAREPKAESIRVVPVPPHMVDMLTHHLRRWVAPGNTALLFPATERGSDFASVQQVLGTSQKARTGKGRRKGTERRVSGFYAAREAIGRPTLRLYDLRHWARRIWTLAGLDFASVEMLLGHRLPEVQHTYAHLDLEHVFPYALKVSELAGWTNPDASPAPVSGLAIHPRLLSAMTPEQLAVALAGMTDDQLSTVVPTLDAATLARALARTVAPTMAPSVNAGWVNGS